MCIRDAQKEASAAAVAGAAGGADKARGNRRASTEWFVLVAAAVIGFRALLPGVPASFWVLAYLGVTALQTGFYLAALFAWSAGVGGANTLTPRAGDADNASGRASPQRDALFRQRVGVVIPAHKSAEEIAGTLRHALAHFCAANVVVSDNGAAPERDEATLAAIRSVSADVIYTYTARPNKTKALWNAVRLLPPEVEYVLHLDDDTLLGEHMVFDEGWFLNDPAVGAVSFPIATPATGVCRSMVDLEFQQKLFKDAMEVYAAGTKRHTMGVAGLWRRQLFVDILAEHPTLPFGEDVYIGAIALKKGYKIVQETRGAVTTFAPDVLVAPPKGLMLRVQGYGATSVFKQRAYRWCCSDFRVLYVLFQGILFPEAPRSLAWPAFFVLKDAAQFLCELAVVARADTWGERRFLVALAQMVAGVSALFVAQTLATVAWLRIEPTGFSQTHAWHRQALYTLFALFIRFCGVLARIRCLLYLIPFVPWYGANNGAKLPDSPSGIVCAVRAGTGRGKEEEHDSAPLERAFLDVAPRTSR